LKKKGHFFKLKKRGYFFKHDNDINGAKIRKQLCSGKQLIARLSENPKYETFGRRQHNAPAERSRRDKCPRGKIW
jgi:hypothetical protein